MSYYYPTANLNVDIDNREREQKAWLNSRPVCCRCKEPIQEERCYIFFDDYNDDRLICEECIKENDKELQVYYI